ncbi:unnamed protein product [marine sediment metagenome]|uniref:LysM domain-containing protein n=1 Tax=marine sediment metagenome TaxID=412755 RepID=X1PVX3_9ZZZZ
MPTVPPTPSPEVITYTVRAGDALAKIAAQFGTTVEEIVEANEIEDANRIEVGQVLVIPQGAEIPILCPILWPLTMAPTRC